MKSRYIDAKAPQVPDLNTVFRTGSRLTNQSLVPTIHNDTDERIIASSLVSFPKSVNANTKEADILAGCSALLSLGCQSA